MIKLEIIGICDDVPVINGSFLFHDTYGLPLELFMDAAQKYNRIVAMDDFVSDAVKAGWSFDKAVMVCWSAWADTYGPRKADELKIRLENGMKTNARYYWPEENNAQKMETTSAT